MTDELNMRIRELERLTTEQRQKMKGHEDLCTERYQNLNKSLTGINKNLSANHPLKLVVALGIFLTAMEYLM